MLEKEASLTKETGEISLKQSELCAIKINQTKIEKELAVKSITIEGKECKSSEAFLYELGKITGITNQDLLFALIENSALPTTDASLSIENQINVVLQSLSELQPKDATETMLCLQLVALHLQGMRSLKKAGDSDFQPQIQTYMTAATKLIRLQHETLDTLNRYRRKGDQHLVVQHVNVNEGANAIVGQVNTTKKVEEEPHVREEVWSKSTHKLSSALPSTCNG